MHGLDSQTTLDMGEYFSQMRLSGLMSCNTAACATCLDLSFHVGPWQDHRILEVWQRTRPAASQYQYYEPTTTLPHPKSSQHLSGRRLCHGLAPAVGQNVRGTRPSGRHGLQDLGKHAGLSCAGFSVWPSGKNSVLQRAVSAEVL